MKDLVPMQYNIALRLWRRPMKCMKHQWAIYRMLHAANVRAAMSGRPYGKFGPGWPTFIPE
jgi:hypothetical protein